MDGGSLASFIVSSGAPAPTEGGAGGGPPLRQLFMAVLVVLIVLVLYRMYTNHKKRAAEPLIVQTPQMKQIANTAMTQLMNGGVSQVSAAAVVKDCGPLISSATSSMGGGNPPSRSEILAMAESGLDCANSFMSNVQPEIVTKNLIDQNTCNSLSSSDLNQVTGLVSRASKTVGVYAPWARKVIAGLPSCSQNSKMMPIDQMFLGAMPGGLGNQSSKAA